MHAYQIREDDAIDDRHPVEHIEPVEDLQTKFAEAQCRLVVWMMSDGTPDRIAARVLILATALNLTINTTTESDIARTCGITRSAVSLMAIELDQQFGIKSYNLRPEGSRERCRKAQKSRKK